MPSINRVKTYIDMACIYSSMSYASRLKVGCLLTKGNRIISAGYNGTPPGTNNKCEDIEIIDNIKVQVTKKEVIHAEMNAIISAVHNGVNVSGSIMYLTHSPCIECAKYLKAFGIIEIYYKESYRDDKGIDYLIKNKIDCIKVF